MPITLRQLSVFVAVARHGSMTQACEALFMTKGAVSQTLAELERRLGVRLFDRQHARLYLNHEGKKLLPIADELLERQRHLVQLFGDDKTDAGFRLGCTRTIGSYLLPDMLEAFERRYGWMPEPVIANTTEITGMLDRFEVDMALLEGPVTGTDLITEPWLEDEMVVVAGKHHPLTREQPVSLERLGRERWLLREPGSGSRAFFDNGLAMAFVMPPVVLSFNASDALLSCVYRNLGITFISSRMLTQPLYAGHFVPLVLDQRFRRQFTLCYHRNKFLSAPLEKWRAFSRNQKNGSPP